MNTTLIHAAISTAAVYVPAYVLKASLTTTLLIWAVAITITGIVMKTMPGGSGDMTGLEIFLVAAIPFAVMGYKFGVKGAAYLLLTAFATAFVRTIATRLL